MATYFIVILSVCFLCKLAEDADYTGSPKVNEVKVTHTADARYFYIVAASILILVSGLRYKVGTDYWTYYNGYSNYIKGLPEAIRSFQAPGFGVIAWLGTWFYDDGAVVIFLCALITVGLILYVIYQYTDKLLMAVFLYITLGCWHGSFNGVRQYLAVAVLFCGIGALKEEKCVKWLAFVLLAALFHRSVLVMAVLCVLVYRKIDHKNLIIFLTIAFIAIFSYQRLFGVANFIMDKEYDLARLYTSRSVNRLRVIAAILPACVFYLVYKDKEDITRTETFYMNLSLIHAGTCILTMNSALLYRIGTYTTPFQAIVIPELLKGISDKYRKIITAGILTMRFAMWCYELSINRSLSPFQFIWNR